MVRIIVLSDIKLYRECVASALARFPRYEAMERPFKTREAMTAIEARSPQIALIDVRAPEGLSMMERIRVRAPRVIRIALAVRDDPDEIIACAEAGALSYLVQDASISELAEAIDAAVEGRLRCSARIAQSLFAHVGRLAVHRKEMNGAELTGREREILSLIERGKSNKMIALDLGIEVSTVKNHIQACWGSSASVAVARLLPCTASGMRRCTTARGAEQPARVAPEPTRSVGHHRHGHESASLRPPRRCARRAHAGSPRSTPQT